MERVTVTNGYMRKDNGDMLWFTGSAFDPGAYIIRTEAEERERSISLLRKLHALDNKLADAGRLNDWGIFDQAGGIIDEWLGEILSELGEPEGLESIKRLLQDAL